MPTRSAGSLDSPGSWPSASWRTWVRRSLTGADRRLGPPTSHPSRPPHHTHPPFTRCHCPCHPIQPPPSPHAIVMTQVRTRFAPSPTGRLHVGNLRVAVFNHLFTRRHGGRFILRVEDTDVERNVEGSLEGIMEDLRWAGLDWDEGPGVEEGGRGPYRQSERGRLYREAAHRLEAEGRAYRCFCPDEGAERERDGAAEIGCPGGCRFLPATERTGRLEAGEPSVLRFATPDEVVSFRDEVRGVIAMSAKDLGDFIILRADGRPTYNFAVVVDDVGMEITHVIRGAGHLSNTPKQVLLFDALGVDRPIFAHLPTVLGPDRKKLSKRRGAPGVADFRAQGVPADAVVNYLSLLGWSPGDDREILTRDELVEAMDLGRIGASNTIFDPEKLRWVSSQHLAAMPLDEVARVVEPYLDRTRFPLRDEQIAPALDAIRTRLEALGEVNEHLAILFPTDEVLQGARDELRHDPGAPSVLLAVREALAAVDPWEADALAAAVRAAGKEVGARGKALFHPVRLALTGDRQGPDLGKVMAGLGRKRVLMLLDESAGWVNSQP
ncbi:MAG: glutamate--tRNA ligase [Gemmatimonadales bacterium]|nr:MAG: glutamate--tRNA ligase [Gemmatimonadales bacterium]